MILEERICPNCGSNEVLEKDGTFVCMDCHTFFNRPKEVIIKHITRDENEIERFKSEMYLELDKRKREEEQRKNKEDWKIAIVCMIVIAVLYFLFCVR